MAESIRFFKGLVLTVGSNDVDRNFHQDGERLALLWILVLKEGEFSKAMKVVQVAMLGKERVRMV